MPVVEPTARPEQNDLAQWLRLVETKGVGIETALRLLRDFGPPAGIFGADLQVLEQSVGARVARALHAVPSAATQTLIAQTLRWQDQPGNALLTLADPRYPSALLEIPDPPILLYAKGNLALLQTRGVAVVGSRNATAQGLSNAAHFSHALSLAGHTIISGMALGIDAAAHRGGLAGRAATVAVIGTGLDIVYPARNRALAHSIAEAGCIVSEYALGTPAIAGNFPRRNRLISGLSRAVLVVEAAAQSGSLITARVAAEQGRDVFAIPGSIHSPLAKGCHQLIKQGAKLVESVQDVFDELGTAPIDADVPATALSLSIHDAPALAPATVASVPEADTAALFAALGFDPVGGDALAARCGLGAAALSTQLLSLELQGLVEMLPGGRYQRIR